VNDAATKPDAIPSPAILMPDTDAAVVAKKRPGRPRKSPTPETTQQQIERVEAQLQKLKEARQKEEQERDLVVGRAIVADALEDAGFRKQLAARLRKRVTGKADLTAIAELLA
jgi:hypothetical protein